MNPDILFVDNHNFVDFPFGGTFTFAMNLLQVAGERFALVGITTNHSDPVGKWFSKRINGRIYPYFAYRYVAAKKKPLIPNKVSDFLCLRRYLPKIRENGIRKVFVQPPSCAIALSHYEWESICFRFTGVFNPVANSIYPWARPLGKLYERCLFKSICDFDPLLATADDRAIDELVARSRGVLQRERLHKFPTRVDTGLFDETTKEESRSNLGIAQDVPVFLCCTRITWTKGWNLVLEGFERVAESNTKALLLFVGSGEDVPLLERKIEELKLDRQVCVIGSRSREEVIEYYMAADVYCVASYIEGWSNSMLEALAAGCALVSTDVSGAYDLIDCGGNGFVLESRDPDIFGGAMLDALELPNASEKSLEKSKHYSLDTLLPDLHTAWPLSPKE